MCELLSEEHQICGGSACLSRKLHSKVEAIAPAISEVQVTKVLVFVLRFFFFFLHKHKNHSNSGMHAWIELDRTRARQPKANISTKFGGYPTERFVVISDKSCKKVDLLTSLQGKPPNVMS